MNYSVRHKTSYSYADGVSLCQNILRLRPRDHPWQKCLKHELKIAPTPSSHDSRVDFFGNHVTWISLDEHHKEFHASALSEVRIDARPELDVTRTAPWESVRDLLKGSADPAHIEARQYAFDSPHVALAAELAEYAGKSFTPGRPIFEANLELTQRIHTEFSFVPGSTDLETSALDVLRLRRGVCQDFAHLQIGCLRSLGLAARYVSGYLATKPPPGRERLVGADASHAWVGLFEPAVGWVDFDPTNGLIPAESHITLAWARDYDEIAPVRGITVGGGSHWLGVAVDVVPIKPEEVLVPS